MKYTLKRDEYRPDGIFGALFQDDSEKPFCVTLERAYKCENGYEPKLPAGTYECKLRESPKFGRKLFQVFGVPPFHGTPVTFIEIHIGNFNHDSIGCILLGKIILEFPIGSFALGASKDAFNAFMNSLDGQETFPLTVL